MPAVPFVFPLIENNFIKETVVALCGTSVGHFLLVTLQTDSARLPKVYNHLNCVCVCQCMFSPCVGVKADTTLSECHTSIAL